MLIVRILCSGLGFILADEKRTSKIQIVHRYRAIVMWMWQNIYLPTSTEKKEYSQFHAFRLCTIHLLCLTFTPSVCGHEAETTSKQSSVVYLLQSSGKKMFSKEGCSLLCLNSQSTLHLPCHATFSTWWCSCLLVFYSCFNLSLFSFILPRS